jgi:uncharacterized protein
MPYGGYGGFYFDPMYFLFLIPAMLLTLFAQSRVRSAYAKWSKVRNNANVTGTDVARILLPRENLRVTVQGVPNELGDHYDPANNILRLSPTIANTPTIAAMAVAAHEIGHAEQDDDGYLWLKLRAGIVPLVQFGSSIGYILFFIGLMMQFNGLAWIGVALFSAGALFAVITLPVELDASNRAMRMLNEHGIIRSEEERRAARDMLNAAALTYFAAAAQAILTVLYYVFLLFGSSGRRRNEY